MYVKKVRQKRGYNNYYLAEKVRIGNKLKENILLSYGRQPPTFYKPILYNDLCENRSQELEEKSVDLIIDDPPYSLTQLPWDIEPDWGELAYLYDRVLKDNGLIYIFGKQPMLTDVAIAFSKYFDFRFEIIWNKKNNPWVSNYKPIVIHENIYVFKKKKTPATETNFKIKEVGEKGKPYNINMTAERKPNTQGKFTKEIQQVSNGLRYPTSILEIPRPIGDEYIGYPTQKPEKLISWIIHASSDRGGLFLDPHGGSASTLLASIFLCRKAIGIEVSRDAVKSAQERIDKKINKVERLKNCYVDGN